VLIGWAGSVEDVVGGFLWTINDVRDVMKIHGLLFMDTYHDVTNGIRVSRKAPVSTRKPLFSEAKSPDMDCELALVSIGTMVAGATL